MSKKYSTINCSEFLVTYTIKGFFYPDPENKMWCTVCAKAFGKNQYLNIPKAHKTWMKYFDEKTRTIKKTVCEEMKRQRRGRGKRSKTFWKKYGRKGESWRKIDGTLKIFGIHVWNGRRSNDGCKTAHINDDTPARYWDGLKWFRPFELSKRNRSKCPNRCRPRFRRFELI